MGWRNVSQDSLSYPLAEGVRLIFYNIAEDAAYTIQQLNHKGLIGAPHAALKQLYWLELKLRRILAANELALSVAMSVSQPTTSTS